MGGEVDRRDAHPVPGCAGVDRAEVTAASTLRRWSRRSSRSAATRTAASASPASAVRGPLGNHCPSELIHGPAAAGANDHASGSCDADQPGETRGSGADP